jgi:signal-transduction protein with cAMP-binding, CBS, and nucleotidyltransferase domain
LTWRKLRGSSRRAAGRALATGTAAAVQGRLIQRNAVGSTSTTMHKRPSTGASMDISSLCDREVVSVPASASIRQAASAMRDQHVGALAVTDPNAPGRVIGIVTDRDLVLDVLATGRPVEGEPIGAVCRTELAGVPATASLQECVEAMRRANVRRLLVMGADGAVVGLVSMDDLLQAVANELHALAATVRTEVLAERVGKREDDQPRLLYITRNEP